MKKGRFFLIALVLIFTFLLVYSPHFRYPYPRHIDEWHHITETIKLQGGEYPGGIVGFRFGFHIMLLLLSKVVNLLSIYRFLPALWAVLSAVVLFYVVYKKTGGRFSTALFAMLFFASIKSNVNITGLWFFTPLTFSIPFIFLYVYLFTEGVEKQNKKFILSSLAIMLILLPVHSISVLFAIPFLLIYSALNSGYIKKEWKFFSAFLMIPVAGLLFFKYMAELSWNSLLPNIIHGLQFRHGWGVLDLDNSFFEVYSLAGYILAIAGLVFVFRSKNEIKKYLAYGLWPVMLLISIIFYRITGVSWLSPYQRNLYYFAISLPLLSALGLDYLLERTKQSIGKIGTAVILGLILVLTFAFYFDIPKRFVLYRVIDDEDEYQALSFLSAIPEKRVVMAMPRVSTALYAVSGHRPVGTYFFYGNRRDAEQFFYSKDMRVKQAILDKYNVKYVLSESRIQSGWKLIYDKGNYIYEID